MRIVMLMAVAKTSEAAAINFLRALAKIVADAFLKMAADEAAEARKGDAR